MKRLLSTTAVALMLSTTAYAANELKPLETYQMDEQAKMQDIRASDLIGMRIYSVENDYDRFNENYTAQAGEEKEWDDIGEVNDVVLSFDGKVQAVVLGVGGFIGIGEKDIAVPMSQLKVVREKDDQDDFFLVVNANKQTLTDAAAYKPAEEMNKDVASADVEKPMTEAETSAEVRTDADGRPLLPRADIKREGYEEADVAVLTAEDLEDAVVYDSNDENIGEIDNLVLSESGQIEKVVLDIGGFLGMGEKEVAVTFDELQIIRNADGSDLRIYVGASKEELEAQPSFDAE